MKNVVFLFLLFSSFFLSAQQIVIKGTVTDFDGAPLPGANIIIKGTSIGTQTDFDGNYSITAYKGAKLMYNYIGYKTKEIEIQDLAIIHVSLEEDYEALEEVVVSGVSIRGIGSVERKSSGNKAKSPLYIIDGIPIQKEYNNIVETLNSNDIVDKKILKGIQARNIYGNIALNGCIIITTVNGNYAVEKDENYARITENQFKKVEINPLSTFSIDVDKAAYSNVRRFINNGQEVPVDAVKIEEMINYFDYDYPQPKSDHPFSVNTEVAKTPWNTATKLVRVGLQGKEYLNEELPASNLTFLIDVSGSMSDSNKLPLLKSAFKLLINQLREKDRVSIVVYAGAAGVVLEPTSGNDKLKIMNALNKLEAGGSTAGGQGIELG